MRESALNVHKETTLCDFMYSVYNNNTVNLLCSRRDNIIKPVDGTVLTPKGLEVYKKKVKEKSQNTVQNRVQSRKCVPGFKKRPPGKQASKR